MVFPDTMTKATKEDVPWLHDDFEGEFKLYNKKTGEYTDLTEDQARHMLRWLTRKQNEEFQKEMK